MKNKYRLFSVLSIVLSLALGYLSIEDKKEYISIVIDFSNDQELINQSNDFVTALKTSLENTGKYKVYLSNQNDGINFLEKRYDYIKSVNPQLVINFDNNYLFNEIDGIEIFGNPKFESEASCLFAEILKKNYEDNSLAVAGVYFPLVEEFKPNTYRLSKLPLDSKVEMSIDIFELYKYPTVVVANVNFNEENLSLIYFNSVEEYFK